MSRIVRAVEKRDCTVTKPKRGSHWKISKPGSGHRSFPVPASNGNKTDVKDNYIRALCRNFEFDEDEFRADL